MKVKQARRDELIFPGRVSVLRGPRLLLLGPTILQIDGVSRPIARQTVRNLAIALGAYARTNLSTDLLIELLWGDNLPADPRAALSVVGSRLRTELQHHRDLLVTDANGWSLDIDTDIHEFLELTGQHLAEAQSASAMSSPSTSGRDDLERALWLWRGEPATELVDHRDFFSLNRLLADRRRYAATELATILTSTGAAEGAVELLSPLWNLQRDDERVALALARAQAARGRRSEALATLDGTRRASRAAGLVVTEAVRQLELEILRHGTEISVATPTVTIPVASAAINSVFIGRADELSTLSKASSGCTLVIGDAGVGKSALLQQAAQSWSESGRLVVNANAPQYAERPAEVVTQLVAHLAVASPSKPANHTERALLARFLPHLASDDVPAPPTSRQGLVSSLATYISVRSRMLNAVIVVDDLHWIDAVSAEVITALDDTTVIVASRPLFSTASQIVADSAHQIISLSELSKVEIRQLLERAGSSHVTPSLVRRVTERSGGNALFATLLVDLILDGVDSKALPASLLLAVQRRLDELSLRTRRTLCVASVFGPVAPTAGIEALVPDALTDLLDAARSGLIAIDDDTSRFVHHLVFEVVQSLLSDGERIEFHERAGQFLESNRSSRKNHPIEIAHHFDVAATLDPLRAARAHSEAARAAADAFDWERVAFHSMRGITLVGDHDPKLACELVIWLGRSQRVLHRHDVDVDVLINAAVAAKDLGDEALFAETVLSAVLCAWDVGGVMDERLVAQYRRALKLDLPPALAAELRAVACTFTPTKGFAAARELYHDAVAIARDLPKPADRTAVLRYAKWGLGHIEDVALLDECAVELSNLAGADLDLFWAGATNRFAAGVITADRARIDAAVVDMRNRHAITPRQQHAWSLAQIESAYALVDDDPSLAELWLERMAKLANKTIADSWARTIYTVTLASVRRQQGRIAELLPIVTATAQQFDAIPASHCLVASVAAAAGDLDTTRRELAWLRQPGREPYENLTWSWAMVLMADAVVAVGDTTRASNIFERLRPYAHHVAWTGLCSTGLIADSLADLAETCGDTVSANQMVAQAEAMRARLVRLPNSPPLAVAAFDG